MIWAEAAEQAISLPRLHPEHKEQQKRNKKKAISDTGFVSWEDFPVFWKNWKIF